jgi:hypothetical protein
MLHCALCAKTFLYQVIFANQWKIAQSRQLSRESVGYCALYWHWLALKPVPDKIQSKKFISFTSVALLNTIKPQSVWSSISILVSLKSVQVMVRLHIFPCRKDNIFARNENIGKICETYLVVMSPSWNFPARAKPSYEGSEPSRAGAL